MDGLKLNSELMKGRPGRHAVAPTTYFVVQEDYDRLVDNVINAAQPPMHMSCDWLRCEIEPLIYPLKVYRVIEELKHANTNSQHSEG